MKLKIPRIIRPLMRIVTYTMLGSLLGAVSLYVYLMNKRPDLHLWHTVRLDLEYTVEKQDAITSFGDYLTLEEKLFGQLQTDIYNNLRILPSHQLNRFIEGSLADPTHYSKNWNRSFIMAPDLPRGGVVLLHGLSDSPYSLRALARELYAQGYYVLGLRMPGHGTAPSGLLDASWQDMAAAVKLAVSHVSMQIDAQQPLHLLGYSMGAAQAVNHALDTINDKSLRQVTSLVLISPAIGVSGVAALAIWQARLATIPGLEKLAWNTIGPEYDPYKYTSFAVNAGDQMYRLTLEVNRKMAALQATGETNGLPKVLALLSLVDATVSANAAVTHLLDKLDNAGNELVLFDLNRHDDLIPFLKIDPVNTYRALIDRDQPGFDLTFITNESLESNIVIANRWPQTGGPRISEETGMAWPDNIYSLSHIALPIPPTDSLYGSEPEEDIGLHIGQLEMRGERGVLQIPASDMLRLRYNPFYSYMQQRISEFLEDTY